MTKIEALELELKARKMVEGTGLYWYDVIRCAKHKEVYNFQLVFDSPYGYELALGIIEGKPVWEGDKHYDNNGNIYYASHACTKEYLDTCSWNPPAKTIMVELLVADVACLTNYGEIATRERKARVMEACRKALDEMK